MFLSIPPSLCGFFRKTEFEVYPDKLHLALEPEAAAIEILHAFGNDCGGVRVNSAFETFLERLVSDIEFSNFFETHPHSMICNVDCSKSCVY